MQDLSSTSKNAILDTGFWFVDIPRTSSSALRTELGAYFGAAHGKKNIAGHKNVTQQLVPDHQTGLQMRDQFGSDAWAALFTFSVVRNPWSRMVSFYRYRRDRAHVRLPLEWQFNDYLHEVASARRGGPIHEVMRYPPQYMSCSEFLYDTEGTLLVDHVVRFENRDTDLDPVRQRIGVQQLGSEALNQTFSDGNDFRDYYDDTSRDLVGDIFAEDCKNFGYSFDRRED